ncbi:MAG TPA: hypothetical protein VKV23_02140 [Acidimicrobiales bacterium]|nr:hypothetical protein [Acidimicrobiales bacterium]
MARRIDIELTSRRADGSFTWRAAGALQPRGSLDAGLVPPGARVGDVLRAEVEAELEGLAVTAVAPLPTRQPEQNRIELRPAHEGSGRVTATLLERRDRRRREPATAEDGERRAPRRERRIRRARATGPGEEPARGARAERREPTGRRRPERAEGGTTRPARLAPARAHRDALIASLPPEQRPIAERLADGGLPAVRRALAEEEAAARSEGRPSPGGEAIIALAEELLPAVRQATWLDRAEAAVARLDTITLRDLRASVVGAAPRDEHGRALLGRLREALDERRAKLRAAWEADIARALEEGRVLQALRLAGRPPEPSTRLPAALVAPLAEAASAALSPSTPAERWIALLEAAAASPLRRSVKPAGLPDDPTGDVRRAAALAAGRVPALAPLLGLAMPPPPRPVASAPRRSPRASRRPAPGQPRPSGAGRDEALAPRRAAATDPGTHVGRGHGPASGAVDGEPVPAEPVEEPLGER